MAANGWQKYDSITLGTGNILENEEFKKAKNPTQEVSRRTFDAGVDIRHTEIDAANILIIAAGLITFIHFQKR
jgi:hypothetical protein